MMEVPEILAQRVKDQIVRDMKPSLWTLSWKSGFSVVLGGTLSLLVCGQFGVGITHAAMHINNELHAHGHDHFPALLFGIAFALIPPFILRLICTSLQYRVITRKPAAAFAWFVGLGLMMAHQGEVAFEAMTFVLWSAACAGTFQALSRIIDRSGSNLSFPWLAKNA